jgi:hypothetical protein
MSAPSKAWLVGVVVILDGVLAPWLVFTWLFIYQQHSYPIDYFSPLQIAYARATNLLISLAVTLPVTFFLYHRSARDLPPLIRVISLVIAGSATAIAIAFSVWRFLR